MARASRRRPSNKLSPPPARAARRPRSARRLPARLVEVDQLERVGGVDAAEGIVYRESPPGLASFTIAGPDTGAETRRTAGERMWIL